MLIAFVIAQFAALAFGYFVRPTVDDYIEERRFLRHCSACRHCAAVRASDGPAWLYCADGRPRGAGTPWERRLRLVGSKGDGVPVARQVRGGN